uniref:Palmitoyl protein thioesterase-like protein n=1 Tax=Mus musculus TaxID=10090 RepID=Q8R2F8_MOUSE|nr:palmitoyl protein thioesterase-like protein [Mus musculus]
MVLPRSLWLLSVCLLSWCCDARSLGPQDLQLESWQITFVFLHLKGETISMDDIEVMFQMNKAGAYVPSVETEKAVMEDMDNKALYVSSHAFKILPKQPKLRHGHTDFKFPEPSQMWKVLMNDDSTRYKLKFWQRT